MAIRIVIVDDHQIVLDGLVSLLKDIPDFELVYTTTHPQEVLSFLQLHPAEVLLTDVMMGAMNGQELSRRVRSSHPHIKILALSMSSVGDIVDEMINDADINGYVLKNIGKAELEKAIRKIAAGGIYFSDEVLAELEKTAHQKKDVEEAHLTSRELEIVKLIEKELSNKEIAEQLFISERTVETHRKNIFRKTKTNGVVGLLKYAYEHKLI